ncbi:MAG: CvpA family protein [Oscillospiraceae bacterium]|nr:CvpA family protein [Oscillospiraceae bacterium]
MLTTPQIIDIALLVIILISAIKCFIDGFATSVVKLVGNIAGLVAAWYLSKRWSPMIFENMFRENIVEKTYKYIQDGTKALNVQELIEQFTGSVPASFVQEFAAKAEEVAAQITQPTMETAEKIVDAIVGPALTVIIMLVIFAIAVAVFTIVASLLAKIFKVINKIPVLGFANRMGGFVVGVLTGIIYVILISCVLSIIAIITENSLTFLNIEVLNQSKILSLTGLVNPFIG